MWKTNTCAKRCLDYEDARTNSKEESCLKNCHAKFVKFSKLYKDIEN